MIKMIAQTTPQAGGGGLPMLFVEMALIFGGFYFLFIAPQKKKQKEHEKMLGGLQTGDEVITTGGIYGQVTRIGGDSVQLQIADLGDKKVRIEISKAAVGGLQGQPQVQDAEVSEAKS